MHIYDIDIKIYWCKLIEKCMDNNWGFFLFFLPDQLLGYSEKPINLQMFIGTADDRYLRPHAFYQVHRITGKTVATASQEIIIASTKVLEIPLLPENNMSARYFETPPNKQLFFFSLKKLLKKKIPFLQYKNEIFVLN